MSHIQVIFLAYTPVELKNKHMSKELLISLVLGAVLLFCIVFGIFQASLLSNPFFLLFGLAIILGQVIMAHLAFNQYKNLSTQTTKESIDNEEGREEGREERGTDGFDD
jgi:hypothetical protein